MLKYETPIYVLPVEKVLRRWQEGAVGKKSPKMNLYSVISFLKRLKYIHSMTLSALEPVASMLVR